MPPMTAGQRLPLDEVCTVEYGTRVVHKRDGGSIHPVYGGGGATFHMDEFNREDRLVVARFGMSEECTRFVPGQFFLNDSGLTLAPRSGALLQRFVDYQMLSLNDDIYALGKGSAQRNLDVSAFRNLPLFVPSDTRAQHRIVGILDEAFEGITAAKAKAEKNLGNARAIFDSHVESIFTQRGDGWVERRLGDIAKTQYGLSEPMNEEGRGFRIFRMGEVQGGRLIDTGRMKCASIDRAEFEKYRLSPGDVLFNRTNSFELVGKTGVFDLPGDYCFASYLVRVLVDRQIVLPEVLNYFMNSERFQGSVKQKASKSINQANINATILSNESVRFPGSLEEQKRLVAQLDGLREETQRLEGVYQRKLAALEALKKALLHRAFAGEL